MLKFIRNQHYIQNNELFSRHLFWGGVITGNWELTFISLIEYALSCMKMPHVCTWMCNLCNVSVAASGFDVFAINTAYCNHSLSHSYQVIHSPSHIHLPQPPHIITTNTLHPLWLIWWSMVIPRGCCIWFDMFDIYNGATSPPQPYQQVNHPLHTHTLYPNPIHYSAYTLHPIRFNTWWFRAML